MSHSSIRKRERPILPLYYADAQLQSLLYNEAPVVKQKRDNNFP